MTDAGITLLRPEWLLALLPIIALGWYLWGRAGSLGAWDKAIKADILKEMAALGRIETAQSRLPRIGILFAMGLVTLALAGPATERRDTPSFRNLDGVLFVIDASESTTEGTLWPQMMTMGRFGLSALGSRPGGLIVYAGDAYVATEMTHDHLQLGQSLSLIDGETVPDKGSRPALGLALAASLLTQAEVIAGDVVLFSDGAGLDAASLALGTEIAALGARLSVVTNNGAAAAPLASAGAGRVFGLDDAEALGAWLSDDARQRLERQTFPLLFRADLGRYLIALSLLPLIFLFRREAA